ncbi:MAG TPA: hypothetical protein VNJ09_05850 [Chthonomonadales bacterium]|nr:hypothetical protein [Chthonomonadales bacterium]
MSGGNCVRLRLHSGIPIVDVQGEWGPAATEALVDMICVLSNAGHYEIVVNIQRAALEGISALRSLAWLAETVRAHCGHINIVGSVEQIEELVRQRIEGLFRLASSEENAIGRIKRIPILTPGPSCTARPRDTMRHKEEGRNE